jgi:hypothetical protein
VKFSLENSKGLSSNGGLSSKKSSFSDSHFSPFQGSFGLRVPPFTWTFYFLTIPHIPIRWTNRWPRNRGWRRPCPNLMFFSRFGLIQGVPDKVIHCMSQIKLKSFWKKNNKIYRSIICILGREKRFAIWGREIFNEKVQNLKANLINKN